VVYRLALIHFIAVQTYNLSSKLLTKTHQDQMYYPASRTSFSNTIRHAEKQPLYWNWAKWSLQSFLL